MIKYRFIVFLIATSSSLLFAWHDDVAMSLPHYHDQFAEEEGVSVLGRARAEVRLGRYLWGDDFHKWRGGVEGDISLVDFGPNAFFHMGLAIETLADQENDISFRLLQVYYRSTAGLALRLGPGVLDLSYRHRCSHGADAAVHSRILIRSGLNIDYNLSLIMLGAQLDLSSGLNFYAIGQNRDLNNQQKGGARFFGQMTWPMKEPLYFLVAMGLNLELIGQGPNELYFIHQSWANMRLEPLFAARMALRIDRQFIKSDFSLGFSQMLDSGLLASAKKTSLLSLDINFYW